MKKNKVGRPSKWESHVLPYIDRIPKMRRQGLTEQQIAYKLGVGETTLRDYKKLYPQLLRALKSGRMELIEDLEETLYNKALGNIRTTKTRKIVEEYKGVKKTKVETYEEEHAPDTGALVFALKNLDPNNWQDRRVVDTTLEIDSFNSLLDEIANIGSD